MCLYIVGEKGSLIYIKQITNQLKNKGSWPFVCKKLPFRACFMFNFGHSALKPHILG